MKEHFKFRSLKNLSKNTANLNLGKNVKNINLNLNPILKKTKLQELNNFELKLKNLNKTEPNSILAEEMERIKFLRNKLSSENVDQFELDEISSYSKIIDDTDLKETLKIKQVNKKVNDIFIDIKENAGFLYTKDELAEFYGTFEIDSQMFKAFNLDDLKNSFQELKDFNDNFYQSIMKNQINSSFSKKYVGDIKKEIDKVQNNFFELIQLKKKEIEYDEFIETLDKQGIKILNDDELLEIKDSFEMNKNLIKMFDNEISEKQIELKLIENGKISGDGNKIKKELIELKNKNVKLKQTNINYDFEMNQGFRSANELEDTNKLIDIIKKNEYYKNELKKIIDIDNKKLLKNNLKKIGSVKKSIDNQRKILLEIKNLFGLRKKLIEFRDLIIRYMVIISKNIIKIKMDIKIKYIAPFRIKLLDSTFNKNIFKIGFTNYGIKRLTQKQMIKILDLQKNVFNELSLSTKMKKFLSNRITDVQNLLLAKTSGDFLKDFKNMRYDFLPKNQKEKFWLLKFKNTRYVQYFAEALFYPLIIVGRLLSKIGKTILDPVVFGASKFTGKAIKNPLENFGSFNQLSKIKKLAAANSSSKTVKGRKIFMKQIEKNIKNNKYKNQLIILQKRINRNVGVDITEDIDKKIIKDFNTKIDELIKSGNINTKSLNELKETYELKLKETYDLQKNKMSDNLNEVFNDEWEKELDHMNDIFRSYEFYQNPKNLTNLSISNNFTNQFYTELTTWQMLHGTSASINIAQALGALSLGVGTFFGTAAIIDSLPDDNQVESFTDNKLLSPSPSPSPAPSPAPAPAPATAPSTSFSSSTDDNLLNIENEEDLKKFFEFDDYLNNIIFSSFDENDLEIIYNKIDVIETKQEVYEMEQGIYVDRGIDIYTAPIYELQLLDLSESEYKSVLILRDFYNNLDEDFKIEFYNMNNYEKNLYVLNTLKLDVSDFLLADKKETKIEKEKTVVIKTSEVKKEESFFKKNLLVIVITFVVVILLVIFFIFKK